MCVHLGVGEGGIVRWWILVVWYFGIPLTGQV